MSAHDGQDVSAMKRIASCPGQGGCPLACVGEDDVAAHVGHEGAQPLGRERPGEALKEARRQRGKVPQALLGGRPGA